MDRIEIKKKIEKRELQFKSKVEQYNKYNKFLQDMLKEILIFSGEIKALKELLNNKKK